MVKKLSYMATDSIDSITKDLRKIRDDFDPMEVASVVVSKVHLDGSVELEVLVVPKGMTQKLSSAIGKRRIDIKI